MFIVPNVVSGLSRMPAEKASTIPCLEVRPRMGGQDRLALLRRELVEVQAEHVVLHAQGHEPHLGLLVARDLRRRVQGDRLPDGHDALLGQAVALQEGAGGVGPVDLEALVLGAVALDEPDVVEHRADVEQLRVVVQAELLTLQRAPQEHPPRVVEQQLRRDVLHELGRLASERAVGDRNPGDGGAECTHAHQR